MFKHQSAAPEDTTNKRTALDEIRQEESKVESLVLFAEQEAELSKLSAQKEAEQVKSQARQAGFETGRAQYEASLQAARFEADQIVAEAQAQAEAITQFGQERILDAAHWAEKFVHGTGGEERQP